MLSYPTGVQTTGWRDFPAGLFATPRRFWAGVMEANLRLI